MDAPMRAFAIGASGRPRKIRLPKLGAGPQIVAAILILGLVGAMAIEPTRQLIEQRERIAGMSHDLNKIENSNKKLEARITRLRDPDFLEQRAREIGLVRTDEIPYVVMLPGPAGRQEAGNKAAKAVEAPAPPKPSFLEGMLHFMGLR
jgi:cell division protein FtsB